MIQIAPHTAGERIYLAISGATRIAAQFVLLSAALVCYGSFPTTTGMQTEYETPLQEEVATGATSHGDLKSRLRGASQRRAAITLLTAGKSIRPTASEDAGMVAPRLSLGLSVPLRC